MAVPINGTRKGSVAGTKGETTPHVVNNGGTSLGTSNGRLNRPLGSHRQGTRPPQDTTMQGPANDGFMQFAELTPPTFDQNGPRTRDGDWIEWVARQLNDALTPQFLFQFDGCPTLAQQIEINAATGVTGITAEDYLPDCGLRSNFSPAVNPENKCCDANALGSCRYRFRIEPQSIFNRISKGTGQRIPFEVRRDILKELIQTTRNDNGSLINGQFHYKAGDHAKFICDGVSDLLECINPDRNNPEIRLGCGETAPPPAPAYVGKRVMVAKRNMRTETDVRNCDNWRFLPRTPGAIGWKWESGSTLDDILKCLALTKVETKIHSPAGTTRLPCSTQTLEPANKDYTPFSGNGGASPAFEVLLDEDAVHDQLVYIQIISVKRELKAPAPLGEPVPSDYIITVRWRYGTADPDVANICQIQIDNSLITWSPIQEWVNRNPDGTIHSSVVTPDEHVNEFGGLEDPGCSYIKVVTGDNFNVVFYCVDDWYDWWGTRHPFVPRESIIGTFGAWWITGKRWGRFEPDAQNDLRCQPPTAQEPNCSCKKSFFMDWLACKVNCDNWCCEYLGFWSLPEETQISDAGWTGITDKTYCKELPDNFCLYLQECTCRDAWAELSDCGCIDLGVPDPYASEDDDRFSDDTGPACVTHIFVEDTSVDLALSASLEVSWNWPDIPDPPFGVNITIDGGSEPDSMEHDGSFCIQLNEFPFPTSCEKMNLDFATTYTIKVWTYDNPPIGIPNYTLCDTISYHTGAGP